MTTRLSSTRNVLLAAAIAAALPAPAIAQEGITALGDIIVTARKREESLQDVPISVSAVSGETLEEMGVPDLVAVGQSMPNVTLEVSRATNSTLTAFIRGVGQQDPVAGFEGGVGIYLDDVYLARPQGAVLDIYDVERIEVLRGPQGTLYGRNTIGGAVKYVTRRLPQETELGLRLAVGEYEQIDAVVTGSVAVTDTFRMGATLASFQRDGFGTNLFTGAEQYDKDILAGRLSFEFEPSDQVFVRLAGDYTVDDSTNKDGHRLTVNTITGAPVLSNVFDSRGGITTIPSSITTLDQEVKGGGLALTIDVEINDQWKFKSVTAYREDDADAPIDFDSLPDDHFDVPAVYENEQLSQEFQLNYANDRIDGVFGLYYLDANAFDAFDVILGDLGVTSFTLGDFGTEAWAAYADMSYALNDQWSVSVGGRYTEDERDALVYRELYVGLGSPYFGNDAAISITVPDPDGVPEFTGSRTDTDFSPRVSVSFRPNGDHNLYASWSQGFKGGSFDPRGAYNTPEVGEGFEPETVDSYELGWKASFAGGRARTAFAIFYSDYEDVQVPASVAIDTDGDGVDDSFAGATTNAAAATIQGIELEGVFQFTDAFSATLAFGYIDAEYDEWLVAVGGVLTDISDLRDFQNTPETSGNLSMRYEWPLSLFGNDGALALIGAVTHRGDTQQFETADPLLDQSSYELYDASLVWTSSDRRYQAGLHGKNLGDKEYKIAGYNFPTLGGGTITAFYGNPRQVFGSFSVKF
ncbi:MAG TPA: TonB-dependent receptor [Steroidobacteraceae bacterium]|nr:TonB-dependent receptor [Steroidobacteraceae bacterium]